VWRRAIAAQTWAEVGANTLADIDPEDNPAYNPNHPASAPWHGSLGQQAMITAWCGGCYDSDGDVLWLIQGGGHGDYGGNEPYKIDLSVDNPAWEMVRAPSTDLSGNGSNGLYGDGRPRSTHTYNKSIYIPGVGPALGALGVTYPNLLGVNNPFVLSATTGEVTQVGAINPYEGASSLDAAGACYDSLRHCVWIQGTARNDMTRWNISSDTYDRFINTGSGRSGYVSLEYMPDHDCIIMLHSNAPYGMRVFDCATGTMYSPTITGSFPTGVTVGSMSGAQVRYVQSGQFVAVWNNSTNTTAITIFSAPENPRTGTWVLGELPVAPGNTITPTAMTPWGTYGRFFYSQKLDGFGVIKGVTQKVYFYARS
jgi:hypothetical protein